jgi:hypothetical protein
MHPLKSIAGFILPAILTHPCRPARQYHPAINIDRLIRTTLQMRLGRTGKVEKQVPTRCHVVSRRYEVWPNADGLGDHRGIESTFKIVLYGGSSFAPPHLSSPNGHLLAGRSTKCSIINQFPGPVMSTVRAEPGHSENSRCSWSHYLHWRSSCSLLAVYEFDRSWHVWMCYSRQALSDP